MVKKNGVFGCVVLWWCGACETTPSRKEEGRAR